MVNRSVLSTLFLSTLFYSCKSDNQSQHEDPQTQNRSTDKKKSQSSPSINSAVNESLNIKSQESMTAPSSTLKLNNSTKPPQQAVTTKTEPVKPKVQANYHVKHVGRSYPVYERREPAPENLSEKEIELHEKKQDLRMVYAEARATGMKNYRNYQNMLAARKPSITKLKKEINEIEIELGLKTESTSRRSFRNQNTLNPKK